MSAQPPIVDIMMKRARPGVMSSNAPTLVGSPRAMQMMASVRPARGYEPTLIVRKALPPNPIPAKRELVKTFAPSRERPRVIPWMFLALIVLGALVRPLHPMQSWHSVESELQLAEHAQVLLRGLR
jgi:hypothetical protein